MNLQEIFEQVVIQFGDVSITVGQLSGTVLVVLLIIFLQQLTIRRWLPLFFEKQEIADKSRKKILRTALFCFLLLFLIAVILGLGINLELYANENISFRLTSLIGIPLAWQMARLADQILSHVLTHNYSRRLTQEHLFHKDSSEKTVVYNKRTVQFIVYLIALFILINAFGLNRSISIPVGQEPMTLSISNLIVAIIVILIAQLFIWILIQLMLRPYYRRKNINIGSQYAINQLIRYVIFVLAFLFALQTLGIQMTLIWGGAAALLVGVGLGLQQTFNDFFSGLVLLFERSVEVGDIVDLGGLVGTVQRIGPRASEILTRDNISVIVPNSKLVVDNVVNWSHKDNRRRFLVGVGVAYGSDTALVRDLLLQAAQQHEKILNFPRPFVRFASFGDSSLDFELYFWSNEFIRIEDVKSDLRFAIDHAFRENQVTIPFPQRDVWFKNPLNQDPARPEE